jgi:Tfp pilus assembly protein PilP
MELIEKTNRIKGEIILPSPLQVAYEVLRPTGIIWNEKEPMALIETSDKLGYTVRKGSLIGPAYGVVETMDQNKIVVVERERDYLGNILSKNKEVEFVQSNK